jgi:hypothetical protein
VAPSVLSLAQDFFPLQGIYFHQRYVIRPPLQPPVQGFNSSLWLLQILFVRSPRERCKLLEHFNTSFNISVTKDRHKYKISTKKDYPSALFTTDELAGRTLLHTDFPHPSYAFNINGTGTFAADRENRIPLSEGERTFRWSVDPKGTLQMTWPSGKLMLWRKISRANDIVVAEFTEPPSPPTKATYRRSKQ